MSGGFQEREKRCQVPGAAEVGLGRGLGLLDKGSQSQGPERSTALRAPRWPPLLATDDRLPQASGKPATQMSLFCLLGCPPGSQGVGERLQGMGLTSHSVRQETTLTFSHHIAQRRNKGPEEQPTQNVSSPGATWPRGLLAPQPGKELLSWPSGGGYLFCFDFFKSLNQINFLKFCSRTQSHCRRPVGADPGRAQTHSNRNPCRFPDTRARLLPKTKVSSGYLSLSFPPATFMHEGS